VATPWLPGNGSSGLLHPGAADTRRPDRTTAISDLTIGFVERRPFLRANGGKNGRPGNRWVYTDQRVETRDRFGVRGGKDDQFVYQESCVSVPGTFLHHANLDA
jgi:hypothetical protein